MKTSGVIRHRYITDGKLEQMSHDQPTKRGEEEFANVAVDPPSPGWEKGLGEEVSVKRILNYLR